MKFKAQFRKDTLNSFIGLLSSLARVDNSYKSDNTNCFLKFTREKLQIAMRIINDLDIYAVFEMKEIFQPGFILESKRKNEIVLSIKLQNLHDALKTGSICDTVNIKLSKRDMQEVLSLEFNDPSLENLLVTQDCPIKTQQDEDFDVSDTPQFLASQQNWNIVLHSTKSILNVLGRSQKIGNDIVRVEIIKHLQLKNMCEMEFSFDSELVSMKTKFAQCQIEINESDTQVSKIERNLKTRHIHDALKLSHDAITGSKQSNLIMLVFPEDDEIHPWICACSSISSIDTCRIYCFIPSQLID